MRHSSKLAALTGLIALLAACVPSTPLGTGPATLAVLTPTLPARTAPAPTQASVPATAKPTLDLSLPITEAGVPRVSVEKAKAAFDAGEAIIVDVRTQASYDAGHIAGAILVPFGDIDQVPAGVSLDKTKWIITYCTWENEQASARAAFILLHNGYPRVSAISGGLQAWEDAGYPVEPWFAALSRCVSLSIA